MSESVEVCVKAANPSLYCVDTDDSFATESSRLAQANYPRQDSNANSNILESEPKIQPATENGKEFCLTSFAFHEHVERQNDLGNH